MSAPADLPFDLDNLPPAVREAFAAMQARVAGLRHALYGSGPSIFPPMRVS